MFTPKPNAVAFSNGTLHLIEDESGQFSLDFKSSHDPKDYLTHKFKFNFKKDTSKKNKMFEDLCDRVLKAMLIRKIKLTLLLKCLGRL